MPIFDKEKRLEKKDIKQQEKVANEQMKDFDLGQGIKSEAKSYGIDLKNQESGPLTAQRKKEIDSAISEGLSDNVKSELEKFQKVTQPPDIKGPNKLDEEQLKALYKKQKKARWWDALYALGEGLQGRTADISKMRSAQLIDQRKGMYDQYKKASESGKKTFDDWSSGYAKQQLDYLKGLQANTNSDLKAKQIQAQIDKIEAETKYIKNKPYTTSKSIGSTSKGPYPTYEYKTDDGQSIKIPMPGNQEDAYRLNNAILTANKLKTERDRLQSEMESEMYSAKSEGWFGRSKEEVQEEIRKRYQPLLSKAESDVKNAESEMTSIFERNINGGNNTETKNNETTSNDPDDLWNL